MRLFLALFVACDLVASILTASTLIPAVAPHKRLAATSQRVFILETDGTATRLE